MKELVATVQSMNGECHRLTDFRMRQVYGKPGGTQTVSFMNGRKEIQRTRDGLAVLYIEWKIVGKSNLPSLLTTGFHHGRA